MDGFSQELGVNETLVDGLDINGNVRIK